MIAPFRRKITVHVHASHPISHISSLFAQEMCFICILTGNFPNRFSAKSHFYFPLSSLFLPLHKRRGGEENRWRFVAIFLVLLFLSRQAVTRQMRDEKRGRERDIEWCSQKRERHTALIDLIFWMGELKYILLYLSIFSSWKQWINQTFKKVHSS